MTQIKKLHLDFLKEIKVNNNKEWFIKNKERYLSIRKEIELFANHFFGELNSFDVALQNPGEKPYMFRIYRDARFAKGKPYKTNYGILITPGGKPSMHLKAGYFLNIEPGNTFFGGGIWRPEASILEKIRKSIDEDSSEIRSIINNKDFKKYFKLAGNKVKTSPKGYKKDHKDIDLLKYKDFYAVIHFSDEEVLDKDFFKNITKLSKILYKLTSYLNNL